MLGNDFLRHHDALWEFRSGQIKLDGKLFPLCGATRKKWCRRVVLQQNVIIPPKSEAILPARVVCNDLSTPNIPGQSWTTQPCNLESGLQMLRSVMREDDVNLPISVLNAQQEDVQLQAGEVLAHLEPVSTCQQDNQQSQEGKRIYNDFSPQLADSPKTKCSPSINCSAVTSGVGPMACNNDDDVCDTSVTSPTKAAVATTNCSPDEPSIVSVTHCNNRSPEQSQQPTNHSGEPSIASAVRCKVCPPEPSQQQLTSAAAIMPTVTESVSKHSIEPIKEVI